MWGDLESLRITAADLGIKVYTYRPLWAHDLGLVLPAVRRRQWWWAQAALKRGLRGLWESPSWAPWLCESNACVSAARGLTRRAAERRMARAAIAHVVGGACSGRGGGCPFHSPNTHRPTKSDI